MAIHFRRRLWACAGILASLSLVPAARLHAQDPDAAGLTIESLQLTDADVGMELRAVSSGTLRLVGVQVDPDGSLVIQMPRHLPGAGVTDLFPPSGLVSAVRLASEGTSRGPLTRIVVSTREAVSHSLSTEQRLLRLRVWPQDAESSRPGAAVELRGQVDRLAAALAESERLRGVLARRAESLEGENQVLAQRFEALEHRRSELDSAMKTTLGQATQLLRELAAEKESLSGQLAAVAGRESELQRQVESLGASLADSQRGRQELAAQLDALVEEGAELARQVDAGRAREAELEKALAQSRREIARLEQEDTARVQAMADQLEESGAREDDLRSQLASLAAVLADVRGAGETPPPAAGDAPGQGTLTRIRTDDGYEGWVRDEPTAVAAAEAPPPPGASQEAEAPPAVAPPAVAPPAVAPPAESGGEPTVRLAAVARRQHALAERLAVVESSLRKAEATGDAKQAVVSVDGQPGGRTTGTLYLRQGPSKAHEALAVVPNGTVARVVSRQGYWLQVSVVGLQGWISGRYFDLEDGNAELASAIAAAADRLAAAADSSGRELMVERQAVMAELEGLEEECRRLEAGLEGGAGPAVGGGRTTVNLSLRRGPGTSFPRLAVLPRGATVSVLSRGDLWHRVRAGTDVGWVFSDFLNLDETRLAAAADP